jgi:heme/copper-type cytochrome/quinol oxidase subunit 2
MYAIKALLGVTTVNILLYILNEMSKMSDPNWEHTSSYSFLRFVRGYALVILIITVCLAIFVAYWRYTKKDQK